MNNRDLQDINSSGELTEIKLGGTADGNKVLTSDEVDAKIPSVGYKVYSCVINLDGALSITVLENTIGEITVSSSFGITFSSDSLFTVGKTFVISEANIIDATSLYTNIIVSSKTATEIVLIGSSPSGSVLTTWVDRYIEIKVYD